MRIALAIVAVVVITACAFLAFAIALARLNGTAEDESINPTEERSSTHDTDRA